MRDKKQRLGRGLDSLLSINKKEISTLDDREHLLLLDIDLLKPGKYQPRKDMNNEALEELAESIKTQGIIQPVIIRDINGSYEIIAGERRWRAAQIAGIEKIPCLVKLATDRETIAMALIENIQREDLNIMEEANALARLIEEFDLSHQEVADAVGKSRTNITNILRLIKLDTKVKKMLENGDLEMGHARALLSLPIDLQIETAKEVASKDLTVRQTESLVNKKLNPKQEQNNEKDYNIVELETRLVESLGAKVSINHNKNGKGKIVINYLDLDELDGIIAKIKKT